MNGLLTTAEAAVFLGRHPGTLANLRAWAKGPKFLKRGRRILYRKADLRAWQLKHKN